MIESEILHILEDEARAGELNGIVDQFRGGRDVSHLFELLDSSHAEVVSIGAWILGELHLALYNSDPLVLRLRKLLDHTDASVRFNVLGALFPALNPQEAETQALFQRLLNDPNEGVRATAKAAAARLALGHVAPDRR
jgi:hypothetical protein